jgi:propionyl-CoA synthetase
MPDRPSEAAWAKLGSGPGLCRECRHAKLNETHRGPAYLRCTRATWDERLRRYPRLPVGDCVGFEPAAGPAQYERW